MEIKILPVIFKRVIDKVGQVSNISNGIFSDRLETCPTQTAEFYSAKYYRSKNFQGTIQIGIPFEQIFIEKIK
jgi:hypothetical protein